MQRWSIGDVRVTAVVESETVFDAAFIRRVVLPDATREALAALPWLDPGWTTADGDPRMVSQAFLIEAPGATVLVDTCIGDDKPRRNPAFDRLQTGFLQALAAAGAAPEDIDVVLCTHLHFDHVGWNTRWDAATGAWVPTFPRARYLFARAEWDYWHAHGGVEYLLADSVQPVVDAGLSEFIDSDHAVTDALTLVPSPGHTPGHVCVRIRSRGAEALITGDMLHHPAQVGCPHWTSPADSDRAQAQQTRQALLDDAAARGVVVMGTHFPAPAAGRVMGAPSARRLVPVSDT